MRHPHNISLATEPYVQLHNSEPLSVLQLSMILDDILDDVVKYRPEFARLIRLQRLSGCRVMELFQPSRWTQASSSMLKVEPQKGNAARFLQLSEIGFTSFADFAPTMADMQRLPAGQYKRAFSDIVSSHGLWRLYDNGFAHPSTHTLRHLKIKEMAAQGADSDYIAAWIGEKSVANLDYYLQSQFFV